MKTRIKELRARDGLTQVELAKRAGVRRETIVFLEKGKYNPSLQLAWNIARIFDLPIEDVFLLEASGLEE
jgi:putative transcriptional regulator